MPEWVVNRVAEALNSRCKALNGSKVLVLGLAYKANVDDDRESPSYVLLEKLKKRGAEVAYHDPYVPVIRPSREHAHWAGMKSVPWTERVIKGFDLVLISTAHANVNYPELVEWAPLLVDTRNALAGLPVKSGQRWKA
jgi:UDP-N-acetyl-D-glucosamine dehydrogenase